MIETAGLGSTRVGEAGERLFALPRRRRPTAAFCANDLVALGLLQHLTQAGIAVPDDLAIVGYDDIEFAGAAAVPLTSVHQPRAARPHRRRAAFWPRPTAVEGHVHDRSSSPRADRAHVLDENTPQPLGLSRHCVPRPRRPVSGSCAAAEATDQPLGGDLEQRHLLG